MENNSRVGERSFNPKKSFQDLCNNISDCGRFKCDPVNALCKVTFTLFVVYTKPSTALFALVAGTALGAAYCLNYKKQKGEFPPEGQSVATCPKIFIEWGTNIQIPPSKNIDHVLTALWYATCFALCHKNSAPIAALIMGVGFGRNLVESLPCCAGNSPIENSAQVVERAGEPSEGCCQNESVRSPSKLLASDNTGERSSALSPSSNLKRYPITVPYNNHTSIYSENSSSSAYNGSLSLSTDDSVGSTDSSNATNELPSLARDVSSPSVTLSNRNRVTSPNRRLASPDKSVHFSPSAQSGE